MVVNCLSGGAKPLGWVICLDVDCPSPSWTGSYMENPAFIGVGLSDVRTIVAIIHVLVEEFTMSGGDGTHPILEYLLTAVLGHQVSHPVWIGPMCCSFRLVVPIFSQEWQDHI
jgi:hypothetical protein